MGRLLEVHRPSLDRLKALDSLPDLNLQLEEATKLCTHASRADMIAKWALERLRSSNEKNAPRQERQLWDVLQLALRLLSPERVAALLSSHNFNAILISTLEDIQPDKSLLRTLSGLVNCLYGMSQGVQGAPVIAVLSIDAERAARLWGSWLEKVYAAVVSGELPDPEAECSSILRPAFHVWGLRRQSVNENELFALSCLAPATLLLSVLSPMALTKSSKRKRDDQDYVSDMDCSGWLETLLARHIFLPARTAFQKAGDSNKSNPEKYKAASFLISFSLASLKQRLAETQPQEDGLLEALPLLLDIALRCTSAPTPRQRTKEKLWIEGVFKALHECNMNSDGKLRNSLALIAMLKVVGVHATLSKERLQQIVREYSNIAVPSEQGTGLDSDIHVNWELVAQITALDADVFTDEDLAQTVFTSVTKAGIELDLLDSPRRTKTLESSVPTTSSSNLLLDHIVVPVMKAFSARRKLLTFVDLWSQQLQHDQHHDIWSVWMQLDEHFQSLLEDSVPEEQISSLVKRLLQSIETGSDGSNVNEGTSHGFDLNSSIVVLNAILGGLSSESLTQELRKDFEKIFDRLLEFVATFRKRLDTQLGPFVYERRVWLLLRRLFERSFPLWAADEAGRELIAKKLASIMLSDAVQAALALSKLIQANRMVTTASLRETSEARCFVACVGTFAGPYRLSMEKKVWSCFSGVIETLIHQLNKDDPEAIVQYSALLSSIENRKIREDFMIECINEAARMIHEGGQPAAALEPLKAVVETAAGQSDPGIIDELVQLLARSLREIPTPVANTFDHCKTQCLIEAMSSLPMSALSRLQREKILDDLCDTQLDGATASQRGSHLRKRLELMIKFMSAPNATCKLSTDASVIWSLALSKSTKEYIRTGQAFRHQSSRETIVLLTRLATLIVEHLLSTQDQERSRSLLLEMSTDANCILELTKEVSQVQNNLVPLALSGSIIQAIEHGAKDDLKKALPHMKDRKIERLPKILCDTLHDLVGSIVEHNPAATGKESELYVLPDLLSMAADMFPQAVRDEKVDIQSITETMMQHITTTLSEELETSSSCLKLAVVRLCEVDCKVSGEGSIHDYLSNAAQLIATKLPQVGTKALIDSFENRIGTFSNDTVTGLTRNLLTEQPVVPESNLPLLRSCVARLELDDSVTSSKTLISDTLPKLLFTATESRTPLACHRATNCILLILKQKSFLTSQYNIEEMLKSLPKYLESLPGKAVAYLDATRILSTLFLNHRARLQGRFHLVNAVFQALLSALFSRDRPLATDRSLVRSPVREYGPAHAQALARLLALYCEPPQPRRRAKGPELVDESRKEQAHVGRYVQYVLHHYCTEVLKASHDDGVREALTPGLWVMIEAIEFNDADGIRSLSASMNNSERAILRDVYEQWKRLGKWRGG